MFNPDGLPVWADRHRLSADVAAHDHDFFEIALVTQGHGLHIACDGDQPIQPGSAIVIPPNQWHAYAQCEDLVVFDSFIAPELIDSTLSFLDAELPLMETVHTSSLPLPQRIQLSAYDLSLAIAELHSMSDMTRSRRSRIQVVGHLLIYLDILSRSWAPDHSIHPRSIARLHPAVSRAAHLMENEPARTWTLADLAAATATERTTSFGCSSAIWEYRPSPTSIGYEDRPQPGCWCKPTLRSATSVYESAGTTRDTSPGGSRPPTDSAPPPTEAAHSPVPPDITPP
ncbi:hypothetical protein GCM10023317_45870 [Actinopolymorpha pittospori]